MLEALTAAIVAASPIHNPQPRRRMRASVAVAASASTAPASAATPASPRHRQVVGEHHVGEPFPGEPRLPRAAEGERIGHRHAPGLQNQFARAYVPACVAIGKQRSQTLWMGHRGQQ